MNIDTEFAWVNSLDHSTRAHFLAALAHAITVVIRIFSSAVDNPLESSYKIRTANEINHLVIGYLVHLLEKNEKKAEWLLITIGRVLDVEDRSLRQQLEQAWIAARRAVEG